MYKTRLDYFYEPDFKKGAKIVKRITGQEIRDGGNAGYFWSKIDSMEIPFIWLQEKNLSTIAHEAVHAAWFILDDVGVKISADNHEALTYLVSYIIKNIKL